MSTTAPHHFKLEIGVFIEFGSIASSASNLRVALLHDTAEDIGMQAVEVVAGQKHLVVGDEESSQGGTVSGSNDSQLVVGTGLLWIDMSER